MMGILCKMLGHSYASSDVAAEGVCTFCGHHKKAIEWPKLPEVKRYPPMPSVVRVEEVELSASSILLAAADNERAALDRMIQRTIRDIDAAKSRLHDLQVRRQQATQFMNEIVNG